MKIITTIIITITAGWQGDEDDTLLWLENTATPKLAKLMTIFLERLQVPSLEPCPLHSDLLWCCKIVFGLPYVKLCNCSNSVLLIIHKYKL